MDTRAVISNLKKEKVQVSRAEVIEEASCKTRKVIGQIHSFLESEKRKKSVPRKESPNEGADTTYLIYNIFLLVGICE